MSYWVTSFKRTKTFGLMPVNIYVLTRMPRDCTAPPIDWDDVMNSPVTCLPDPIQNMAGQKNLKIKSKKKTRDVIVRPNTSLQNVVSAPVAMGAVDRGNRKNLPNMIMKGPTALVRNFEQVGAFPTGNTSFQISGAVSNPGIPGSFPWLSAIAANYQKFRFRYLRFFFSGSCPTSTTGKVFISLTYDGLDSIPSTLAQIMQSEDSCSGPAWFGGVVSGEKAFDVRLPADSNVFVDADCKRFVNNWYLCRINTTDTELQLSGTATGGNGTLALTGDVISSSSFPCKVYYGNNGVTSSTIPGELYVAYEVEFCEPVASALAL
jgi:hypothetical protein